MGLRFISERENIDRVIKMLTEEGVDTLGKVLDLIEALPRKFQEQFFNGYITFGVDEKYFAHTENLAGTGADAARINAYYRREVPYNRVAMIYKRDGAITIYSNIEKCQQFGYVPATSLPGYILLHLSKDSLNELMIATENAAKSKDIDGVLDLASKFKNHPDVAPRASDKERLSRELAYLAEMYDFDSIKSILNTIDDDKSLDFYDFDEE